MADRRRSSSAAVLAVLVLAVLVLAGTTAFWARAQADLTRDHQALHRAQTLLTLRRAALSATQTRLATVTAQHQTLVNAETDLAQLAATVQAEAAGVSGAAGLGDLYRSTVTDCLAGVLQAYGQVAGGNSAAAETALTAATTPCLAAEGGGGEGLAYPFDFPDPALLLAAGTYYGYSTNSVAGTIQVITSPDRVHWTVLANALPSLPLWASTGATWAPSVVELGTTYVLYFSALDRASGDQCVGVALSTTPQGPFTPTADPPVACQTAIGGSTDPNVYLAPDGRPYLLWGSVGTTTHSIPPTLWAEPLSADGLTIPAGTTPTEMLAPAESWEGGANGILEGPTMLVTGGRYFLLYSANNWRSANYAIGLADCAGPLGPCTRPTSGPLLASAGTLLGPGGPDVFTDGQGRTWLAFHAWLPGAVGYPNSRVLSIRPLSLVDGQPVIGSP